MGNLIASYGANRSGASLMLCSNAMNQPQATMKNAYSGDVIDGRPHGLPGEAVMGKGLSEQKATMAAMLHAMDAVIRSGAPIEGRLVFLCCVSGETGRHDAIRNVVETEGVRADMCLLGGNGNRISLGNRGRIDVFITVQRCAVAQLAAARRLQRDHRRVRGPPPPARRYQAHRQPSAAWQADADHQSHPQLPRIRRTRCRTAASWWSTAGCCPRTIRTRRSSRSGRSP